MERIASLPPHGPRPNWRQDWRQNGRAMALSLALHLLLLLAALWIAAHRSVMPQQRFDSVPVDIITLAPQALGSGAGQTGGSPRPGGGGAPARGRPTAPAPSRSAEPAPDSLNAKLQALSQLKSADTGGSAPGPGTGGNGNGGGGGYALRDYVRQQVLRRWLVDAKAPHDVVRLRLTLKADGAITDIVIVNQTRFANDPDFRANAYGARAAAVNASPIPMPPGNYPQVSVLEIDLNPIDALR